jgi:hypothetical protein
VNPADALVKFRRNTRIMQLELKGTATWRGSKAAEEGRLRPLRALSPPHRYKPMSGILLQRNFTKTLATTSKTAKCRSVVSYKDKADHIKSHCLYEATYRFCYINHLKLSLFGRPCPSTPCLLCPSLQTTQMDIIRRNALGIS